ncbi:MAG: nucleotide pyrophosphohydrolase [candidate division WOR-3 bacterium]|nr:nucleotide pyrophosphohydrolase [candidate division WOR-3 bacterium]
MTIDEFQKLIEKIYFNKDTNRGIEGTFMWFTEEVGELSRAIRKVKSGKRKAKSELEEEFADCFAWLTTLASLSGINMEKAIGKYLKGCPKCHKTPCECKEMKRNEK